MPKGEVESDRQAFQQVLGRLEGDVGTVIHLIRKSKEQGCFPNTAPFWSLIRMMFPIAESVGDLIYGEKNEKQKKGPTANLTCVLEKEFAAKSPNYKGKAETLAMLYRHSLIHQDELRSLKNGGKECSWIVSFDERPKHLEVTHDAAHQPPLVFIQFDTTAFYDDLVRVCKDALSRDLNGSAKARYNGWLTYKLGAGKKRDERVIAEIQKL